jgi:hypothetical protein
MLGVGNHHSIDALLPPEMAERIGVQKTRWEDCACYSGNLLI